ncbi:PREDICTED: stomatin-like protein 1 [Priapulus caudatus]|uniref:Stomatin-like protein 1 n=1 Tax=Priapulus caudatus TaxID=37621 RepID=A0ABM1EJE5_PRICU|nr:PREDICTED: stomatin-like protein 1 [Priapulus caudatus]
MAVRYTRLPTDDDSGGESISFESPFQYGRTANYGSAFEFGNDRSSKWKSIFSYGLKWEPTISSIEKSYNPPLLTRCCERIIIAFCYVLVVITLPISVIICFKNLKLYERAVIYRLGHLMLPACGPGLVIIFPFVDSWSRIDLRVRAFNVPPQQVITSDEGAVELGADVQFRISDAVLSTSTVQDLNHATRVLAQTTLTNVVQRHTVAALGRDRAAVTTELRDAVNVMTRSWGVEIGRIELSQMKILKEPTTAHAKVMSVLQSLLGLEGSPSDLSMLYANPDRAAPTNQLSSAPDVTSGTPATESVEQRAPGVTAEQLVQAVRPYLSATLVGAVGATYQFNVAGVAGPDVFHLDLKNGSGCAGAGALPSATPDVTFNLSMGDLQRMLCGQLKPLDAYMSGELTIEGSLQDAQRLSLLLDAVQVK